MAYSTIAQLRANDVKLTSGNIADAIITDRIAMADKTIRADLSDYVVFASLPATGISDSDFSEAINLLSQYKTAELCLVYIYGNKRNVEENSDIDYWQNRYNEFVKNIKDGTVQVESVAGVSLSSKSMTFTQDSKANIEPALGTGKWGEFLDETELEEDRPIE